MGNIRTILLVMAMHDEAKIIFGNLGLTLQKKHNPKLAIETYGGKHGSKQTWL